MLKKLLGLLALISLSGCVSIASLQLSMDKLDAVYRAENEKYINAMGTKYYKISKERAQTAMMMALTNLQMSIENQDPKAGYILARGSSPSPLSGEELEAAWRVEKPRAKEITGWDLELGKRDVIINSIIFERAEDVQINLRFRIKYTGATYGLVMSEQAPPEALKIAFPKIWNEFERVAFVQGKVLSSEK